MLLNRSLSFHIFAKINFLVFLVISHIIIYGTVVSLPSLETKIQVDFSKADKAEGTEGSGDDS